ncbi:MAG: chemotaxis response regulator protein-glutamate methylesterase [Spirochaetia bacterium]|nr:chemotaxis response regulator protein-glutamate methylesterase [Spirochaetia bacterium]
MAKIKVAIVDDSAVVRQVISEILNSDPGIEVISTASDPVFAMNYLNKEWPDVIVLDIEMPRMDGITFLKKIMAEKPTPVVICSTLTVEGAEVTMQAVSNGAVEIITKPTLGLKGFLEDSKKRLIDSVKGAAQAKVNKIKTINKLITEPKLSADAILPPKMSSTAMEKTTDQVVAIGASTGGTQALEFILTRLPRVSPGIIIVQHMPEKFTLAFAQRLNSISEVEVKEAEDGDRVIPGRVLIAPGNFHMILKRSGAQYRVTVQDGPPVSRHRPSVDVLFRSVAREAGKNALGIIMTGMGDDGASGMLEMHESGSYCIAQDEISCIVFGMPAEAIKRGGVNEVLPLQKLPKKIVEFLRYD